MEAKSLIIGRGEEAKEVLDPLSFEGTNERLLNKYKSEKVIFIWKVEIAWDTAQETGDYTELFDLLAKQRFDERSSIKHGKSLKPSSEVQRKAEFYEKKYSGYRISRHEFESGFMQELWRLCNVDLKGEKQQYTFYERMSNAFKMRAIDVVRRETGQRSPQRRFEVEAIPFEEQHEGKIFDGVIVPKRSTMEERFEAKESVREMFESDDLTEEELLLLNAMNDNPSASMRGIAKACGYKHPQKAKRILDSIRDKMQDLNPFD